ncbi:MAG: Hsp20 family protein [Gammaproteobacteria bacterium]|nr:Hsp20 family protein [Gammaproteobacteria bacterium]
MSYDPLRHLTQLYREIGQTLGVSKLPAQAHEDIAEGASQWLPLVDVHEDEEDRFVLLVDVPGIRVKDIEVSLDNGVLTITGERVLETGSGAQIRHSEREHGRFHRRFSLPDTADPERVTASG